MKIAVVVFVKTPGLSPLKTRLAKSIGKEKAEQFFKDSVKQTERTLQAFQQTAEAPGDIRCFWSVAEEKGLADPMWQSFPRFQQVKGGLGDRMHGAYEHLRAEHDFVILLGADCPHMPLDHLVTAKKALFGGEYENVIGPTEDGGFYLFGSGTEFNLKQWNQTEYSLESTLFDFKKHMGLTPENTWTLPELFDVDEIEEYNRLQALS